MNVDEMEAGRELDALVAKAMGCKVFYDDNEPCCGCIELGYPHIDAEKIGYVANYSTNIAAAWLVFCSIDSLEKVVRQINNNRCECYFSSGGIFATAPTAPLAICRAALKAVEVK